MGVDRKAVKALAKEKLVGRFGNAVGVVVVSFLLMAVVAPTVIGTVLLTGPLVWGTAKFFLRAARGEEASVGTLFEGFAGFVKTLVLWLLQALFVLLWSLLFVVPGIVAALRYSQAFFVLADDPSLTPQEALQRSKELTKGALGELFALYLSYVGWFLLGVVTAGLAFLYIAPNFQTTLALYYEGLKARGGQSLRS